MNKIININLGGYPFKIDEDAYQYLNAYLESIHRHFKQSEGYEEITDDIEIRLAELVQEQLANRPIVSINDVKVVTNIMGAPESFGADPMEEEPIQRTTYSKQARTGIKTGRRLFRNPEDKILAGVCSGLTAYFGIKEPFWTRLIVALLIFSSVGSVFLAYIILWIIVPEATTASDRLAMRGEPVNISNIGKIIEEELEEFPQRMSRFGETISEEFRSQKKNLSGSGATFQRIVGKWIDLFGQLFRALFKTLGTLGRPLLIVLSVLLAGIFLVTWIAGVIGFVFSLPFAGYLLPNQVTLAGLGFLNTFFILTIPILGLFILFFRLWTKSKPNNYWRAGIGGFWLLNIASFVFVGLFIMRQFHAGASMPIKTYESGVDTLHLSSLDEFSTNDYLFRLFGNDEIVLTDDYLISKDVRINIEKSDNDRFEIEQQHYSRGRSLEEARTLASSLSQNVTQDGNRLRLPTTISVNKGEKFRGQQITYTIRVPEGKYIVYDDAIADQIHHFYKSNEEDLWIRRGDNKAWLMLEDGMICMDSDSRVRKKSYSFEDFSRIEIEGKINVELYRHSGHSHVEANIPSKYRRQLELTQTGDKLRIYSPIENPLQPIELEIGLPHLEYLLLRNTGSVELKRFRDDEMTLNLDTDALIQAELDVDALNITQGKGSELRIRGKSKELVLNSAEGSIFAGKRFETFRAHVDAQDSSEISLTVRDTLWQKIDTTSTLRLRKQPKTIIKN